MKIGFDFDGTIIDHNKTKVRMCLERGRKIELWEANSNIFENAVGKNLYKEISHSLYREETAKGDIFPGALEVMNFLKSLGNELFIVSARHFDSRFCALDLLIIKGFLSVANHIHFCKESEKPAVLTDLGIKLYVDDKISVLQTLPSGIIKVLFDDQSLVAKGKIILPDNILLADNWNKIREIIDSVEGGKMLLKLKLKGKWSKKLIGLPESGMGYQIVDITLKDSRVIKGVVVINCENVYLPAGYDNIREKDIAGIKMSN